MPVPLEAVPIAMLLGIALGRCLRVERWKIVVERRDERIAYLTGLLDDAGLGYEGKRRPRKVHRIDNGAHFARRPRTVPRAKPIPRRPLDQLPVLGEIAPFPDPRPPRPGKVIDHTRPDGTISPLTSVAHAYDHYRRRVFVVPAAGVDHRTETAELAAVSA